MNRIEIMLEVAKNQLKQYPEDRGWVETYSGQVRFLEWLLEESDEMVPYEIHQKRVSRLVWGIGDISYHIELQLHNKPSVSEPVILVFNYDHSKQKEIKSVGKHRRRTE